jgi:hypothetical protein
MIQPGGADKPSHPRLFTRRPFVLDCLNDDLGENLLHDFVRDELQSSEGLAAERLDDGLREEINVDVGDCCPGTSPITKSVPIALINSLSFSMNARAFSS